jgi:hypothetical protein
MVEFKPTGVTGKWFGVMEARNMSPFNANVPSLQIMIVSYQIPYEIPGKNTRSADHSRV